MKTTDNAQMIPNITNVNVTPSLSEIYKQPKPYACLQYAFYINTPCIIYLSTN